MIPSDELELDISLTGDVLMPVGIDTSSLTALIRHALASESVSGAWEISLRLVDDGEMQEHHRVFMGKDSPTDIMTFPYGTDHPEIASVARGGDIVISVDTAVSNARDEGWSLADEVRFLVLHGVLHLLCWDDQTPVGRQRMLDHQRDLLSSWQIVNPVQEGSK